MRDVLDACGFVAGEIFQLAAISPPGEIVCESFADSELEAASAWARGHAGSSNIYVCGNPLRNRQSRRAKAEHIATARCLLFDCDPEKTPDDPDGLSETSRDLARATCAEARDFLGEGVIVDSGRGFQLWLQVDPADDQLRRALLRGLALKFGRKGVKIDATHDPARLMRLPGYVNLRTGREARIVG